MSADGRPEPKSRPDQEDRHDRSYRLGGQAVVARARSRPPRRRHPDRQSRRHYVAGARNAGRRRPDRLRGHARHPQARRALRHPTTAEAYHDHNAARAAEDTGPPRRGAARWRWSPTPARRSSPIPASSWCRGARGRLRRDRAPGRLGGARRAGGRRPADRPVLFRGLPAAKAGARGARARGAVAVAARWCCSRPARASRSARRSGRVLGPRDAAVCRELTKLHEEVRRGRLDALAANMPASGTRGEFVRRGRPAAGATRSR